MIEIVIAKFLICGIIIDMKDELLFKIANDVVKLKAKEGYNIKIYY